MEEVILTADGRTPLLTIKRPKNVTPKQTKTAGLYHYALLLPSRSALADILHHFIQQKVPLGASDHLVSEALYLNDPDGNGIEIYADRSSSTWDWKDGEVVMATEPLNTESLLAEGTGEPWRVLPTDTIMGHIHLHVSDLERAAAFYKEGLGFDVVCRYHQALFLSTGGYHHHIAINTWNGVGAPAPAENSVGIDSFALKLPSDNMRKRAVERLQYLNADVDEISGSFVAKDPSGNVIQLLV